MAGSDHTGAGPCAGPGSGHSTLSSLSQTRHTDNNSHNSSQLPVRKSENQKRSLKQYECLSQILRMLTVFMIVRTLDPVLMMAYYDFERREESLAVCKSAAEPEQSERTDLTFALKTRI